jgi:hypothetical protein
MAISVEEAFVGLGLQYYVAARSAAWAGLVPVCGNLYHHALELLLKAGLSQNHSLKELGKKPFSHDLSNLWNTFKAEFPSTELPQFDPTIADIDDFEDIRYPDKVLKNGATMRVEFVAHPVQIIASSMQLGVSTPINLNQQYVLYPPDSEIAVLGSAISHKSASCQERKAQNDSHRWKDCGEVTLEGRGE